MEKKLTLQEATTAMARALALSNAAVIASLQQQLGFSLERLQADLLATRHVHDDPLVQELARVTTHTLAASLLLSQRSPTRA